MADTKRGKSLQAVLFMQLKSCFHPLAGRCDRKEKHMNGFNSSEENVSIPLRGDVIGKIAQSTVPVSVNYSFPSPCGAM
ncbi:MAG: hypothetical protein ACYTXC_13215 [Nostoc sp.]